MSRIKSNKLRDKILSDTDLNLIEYIDNTILKINKFSKDSLADNLFELKELDCDSINVAISRVNRLEYSFKSASIMLNILSLMISVLIFTLGVLTEPENLVSFIVVYSVILLLTIFVYGIQMIKYRKRVSTAIYFKSLLENRKDELKKEE